MSLWKIAWRSIQQRGLASSLTGLSMALGVMLVVAVLVIHGVINNSFLNNSSLGYNVLVGAKGGRLDLVLNAVYYLARPVENIPYSFYQDLVDGPYSQYVDKAIPICLGDTYQDYRVVGTTPGFFNDLDFGGQPYEFAAGRNFKQDEFFGAVVGATVARQTGLKVGDTFQPSHSGGPEAHVHEEAFEIVGVLKPTGTPNDRALFINMEGFYLIPDHRSEEEDHEAGASHADEHHEHEGEHAHEEGHEHAEEHEHGEHDAKSDAHEGEEHAGEEHPEHEEAEHDHPEAKAAEADHEHAAEHAHEEGHEHGDAEHDDHAHDDHAHDDHAHDEHGHEHAHDEHDHAHHEHAHEPIPLEKREVTAVLVLTASFAGAPPELMAPPLIKSINEGPTAQAVLPIREMSTLFTTFVDPLRIVLLSLTVMIVIVSGIGILVSIYNSMAERQHEIAVMRALGAGRQTVMLLVLLESILLSLAGGLVGWVVGHGLIALVGPWIETQTGVSVGFLQFVAYELVIIPGLIALAALVGYLPALAAYRTDVAKALSASP